MAHDVRQARVSFQVRHKHHGKEVACIQTDIVGEGEGHVDYGLVEELDIVAIGVGRVIIKREIASEHGIEDNPTGPYVYSRASVQALGDDEFRHSIAWGTT